jgi:hypothetical protein
LSTAKLIKSEIDIVVVVVVAAAGTATGISFFNDTASRYFFFFFVPSQHRGSVRIEHFAFELIAQHTPVSQLEYTYLFIFI